MNDLANNRMSASNSHRIDFDTPVLQRKRRIRALKDRMARWYVSIGGLAVLGCITLIFFYLAYVVAPMFGGADQTRPASRNSRPGWPSRARLCCSPWKSRTRSPCACRAAARCSSSASKDGVAMNAYQLALPAGASIVSGGGGPAWQPPYSAGPVQRPGAGVQARLPKVTYPNNVKTITPQLEYPFGEAPITLDPQGRPLEHVAISENGDSLMLSGSVGAELQIR